MNTYGITLEEIKASCIEEGRCWIWQGALSDTGYPIMKRYGAPCMLVRRVAISLDGRPPSPRQPVVCSCDDKRCVRPDHLTRSTPSRVGKKSSESGYHNNILRRTKIATARRNSATTKLTKEIADEIRFSKESGPVLAERYGVNKSLINKIKRGESWCDYTPNPFIGLGEM